jgi:hypothetical protein
MLLSIRGAINKGLTEVLSKVYPGLAIVERPVVEVPSKIDPN